MKVGTIYTIGHSTHSWAEFLEMLKSFDVKTLVDVRSLPGSTKFPQFNQDALIDSLTAAGITYHHFTDLGGRRKVRKDSKNTTWRNTSFRAYADYMETEDFENAADHLAELALESTTAYMCAEAVWWRCHRAMISDYLKAKGWIVLHIINAGKAQEHPYTSPAKIVNGEISYEGD